MTDVGYDEEERYFHDHDLELITRMRATLDRQRAAASVTAPELKCPRCGAVMKGVKLQQVTVDQCAGCGGVFLDRGELELLTHAKAGGLFKKLFR
jgi:hypothetical protein